MSPDEWKYLQFLDWLSSKDKYRNPVLSQHFSQAVFTAIVSVDRILCFGSQVSFYFDLILGYL